MSEEENPEINNQNQEEENAAQIDPEITQLYNEVKKLRQETNFDISSSLQSAKDLIYDEYMKCVQVATTIFAVYSRSNQNQILCPTYNPEKQSQKFTKNLIYYKSVFNGIFSNPELFAEAVFDRILNEKVDIQLIAFEILPILYGYYIDETCCLKAQTFLTTIIDLIKNNEKESELSKFNPLFESFFLGAYKFHDLLWNNFYILYLKDTNPDSIFDTFLRSLENASLSLYYQLPVLNSLILLSDEDGLKFIISGILKPSLIIYKNLFAGTNVFEKLMTEFQSFTYSPPSDRLQSIHNAFFGQISPIQHSVNVTSISFDKGLPATFLCGGFAKLIRLLKPTDKIVQSMTVFFESATKTLGELEWNNKQTISLPIFYPNIVVKEFPVEKSTDKKSSTIWEQIKKNADQTSVDPLTLIPVLNPSCDHIAGITETAEFAKFALNEEKKELSSKKEYLNYIIGLTMTYKSIENIEKILESITKHAYDTFLHEIMSNHLQISPNLKPAKISSTYRNVIKSIQKMGLPLEAAWVPSFVTMLDNVTANPSIKKLVKQFQNAKWLFKNKLLEDHSKEIEPIKSELDQLSIIFNIILNCPCGQQLWKLYEIADDISTLQSICEDSGINLSHIQIFSYIFPIESGSDFISAFIRIYQIRKLLKNNDVQFPQIIFEKLNLINSWLMSILQTDSSFDVDLFSHEIDKPFS